MSFLETPTASLKNFMCRGERASQGQSQLLVVPIASPKTLGVREERPAFHAGFQIDFISNFGNSILNGLVSTSPFFIFLYNFHVPMVC